MTAATTAQTLAASDCALLLIDFQRRLVPAIAEGEAAVKNAARLAEAARLLDVPVLATEQNPEGLGSTVEALAPYPSAVLAKTHFDATRAQDFETLLPYGRGTFVVTGCEAHVCVLQTVVGLLQGGVRVAVVRDAIGSRRIENRDAGLERMRAHGAELVTTEMAIFEWLEASGHPRFREVIRLVK